MKKLRIAIMGCGRISAVYKDVLDKLQEEKPDVVHILLSHFLNGK